MEEEHFVEVVNDLEKTITAATHLEHLIGNKKTPMVRITFDEFDLTGIEAAYSANKDLLPLRNFLVGKKKGLDKNRCVFGLFCKTEDDAEKNVHVVYYLRVKGDLFAKTYDEHSDFSKFDAKIRISGLGEEPVLLESVSDDCKDDKFWLILESTVRVRKEDLQNMEGKTIITFHLTVSLECTPRWAYETFSLEGGTGAAVSILKAMYNLPESSKDVTILDVNGAEIKVHKNILMAHSPVFCSMLNSENATAEAQSGRILMERNSKEGLTEFIRYLYGLTLPVETFSVDLAMEVFQLSNKYIVNELESKMIMLLTSKGIASKWHSVDSLLELYFHVENDKDLEELRAYALTELSELPTNNALTESEFFKKMDNEKQKNLLLTLWGWSRIHV